MGVRGLMLGSRAPRRCDCNACTLSLRKRLMSKSRSAAATIDTYRSALASPIELDALLAKAGQRDRTNVEKHLAALDAGPDAAHASLWRRLTRALATLAPLAITTIGQQAVQFF